MSRSCSTPRCSPHRRTSGSSTWSCDEPPHTRDRPGPLPDPPGSHLGHLGKPLAVPRRRPNGVGRVPSHRRVPEDRAPRHGGPSRTFWAAYGRHGCGPSRHALHSRWCASQPCMRLEGAVATGARRAATDAAEHHERTCRSAEVYLEFSGRRRPAITMLRASCEHPCSHMGAPAMSDFPPRRRRPPTSLSLSPSGRPGTA
jgi:hypothetical protein